MTEKTLKDIQSVSPHIATSANESLNALHDRFASVKSYEERLMIDTLRRDSIILAVATRCEALCSTCTGTRVNLRR